LTELLANREDLGPGTRHLLEQGDEAASRFGIRGLVRELLERFERELPGAGHDLLDTPEVSK
jgi:hypothetical protein